MELNWTINNLQSYVNYQGYSDVVYKVYWKLTAVETINEKTYSASTVDITDLTLGDIQNFTPFEQLTKEQVVGWLVNSTNYSAITASLADNINQQANPTIVNLPPPWQQ